MDEGTVVGGGSCCIGEGTAVGVGSCCVGEGTAFGVGKDIEFGVNVGVDVEVGAGARKAGMGSVSLPFTVMVVAREIITAVPKMPIMITVMARAARIIFPLGGC